jgi:hypothetical protein
MSKSDAEKLWYLASPYSHPDATVRQARYDAAVREVAVLFTEGVMCLSSIVHSHPVCLALGNREFAFEYWKEFDQELILRCDGIIVLLLEGWRESKGVMAELEFARANGKEIWYKHPEARTEVH